MWQFRFIDQLFEAKRGLDYAVNVDLKILQIFKKDTLLQTMASNIIGFSCFIVVVV